MKNNLLIVSLFLLVPLLLYGGIDDKIKENQDKIKKTKLREIIASKKVRVLATKINTATSKEKKLKQKIKREKLSISKNTARIKKIKKELSLLTEQSQHIEEQKQLIERNIAKVLASNYVNSIAVKLNSKRTTKEIIDTYSYKILSRQSKQKSKKLSTEFGEIVQKQDSNKQKIDKILKLIEKDKQDKKRLEKLNKSLSKTKKELSSKHRVYKKELKKIISQQRKLNSILANLNIVKRQKTQKIAEKPAKIDKTDTQTAKNMNVRSIGYSSGGVKTTRYTGAKTIAPIKDFRIVKSFGETYDKVYKIKLFNDSITLKTKQNNAKVMSVFDGKVVYSKKNSQLLENVVIIKHKNNIHTIYSHLDKIAPNITKGKWLKKGAVIGRVKDTMNFQATKDSSYINPKELF